MHALIVLAHPEAGSFNGQLATAARAALSEAGHAVTVSDLYAEGFDPVEAGRHYRDRAEGGRFVPLAEQRHAGERGSLSAEVEREIARLEAADLVILQFPLWWHAQPAILKGWFDRVFVSGKLYTSRMRYDAGYFRGKRAVISMTTGAPDMAFGPGARGGDLATMLWPIQYSLHYMGFSVLAPQPHFEVSGHGFSYGGDAEKRERLRADIAAWARRVPNLMAEAALEFPGWADWDAMGRPLASP